MLDHPIIDVTLGLVFFYVVLSLVASAVQEWIASVCALRSKNLRSGVENLIGSDYAEKVYQHPLIKNLAKKNRLPSYVAPETFSTVLLEVIAREDNGKSYVTHTSDEARAMLGKITDGHPLKDILGAMVDDGDDAANAMKERLDLPDGLTKAWAGCPDGTNGAPSCLSSSSLPWSQSQRTPVRSIWRKSFGGMTR